MNGEARTGAQACSHLDAAFTGTSCLPTILSSAAVVVILTSQVEEATGPQPYGEAPGTQVHLPTSPPHSPTPSHGRFKGYPHPPIRYG